jgi:hypothetical protein
MKQIFLTIVLALVYNTAFSAEKSTIIKDILTEHVTQKVSQMQHLINFNDAQSEQLKELELNFLLDVQKAENCSCCNSQKKVEKLKAKREQNLQKILTREQFIKYDAIENSRIKKGSLRVEEAD